MTRELTPRESEVVELVRKGLSRRGVARALGVSIKTVDTHIAKAAAKLPCEDPKMAGMRRIIFSTTS
jgi:DNA-binding NarL/FixJ family response regulator